MKYKCNIINWFIFSDQSVSESIKKLIHGVFNRPLKKLRNKINMEEYCS